MLINGIYDPHLFGLKHTDDPEPDSGSFWSSEIRPASIDGNGQYLAAGSGGTTTVEYLEIDYGRVRQVMGLMLSVIKLPFLIGIEYDAISSGEEAPRWVAVTPEAGLSLRLSLDPRLRSLGVLLLGQQGRDHPHAPPAHQLHTP